MDSAAAQVMQAFGVVSEKFQRVGEHDRLPEPVRDALDLAILKIRSADDDPATSFAGLRPSDVEAAADLLCMLNSSVTLSDVKSNDDAADLYLAREINGIDVMGWADLGSDHFTKLYSSEDLENKLGAVRPKLTFRSAVSPPSEHAQGIQHSFFARRLTRAAVALLPRNDRDRYDEEFAAELSDIASSGASPGVQRCHAFRLVLRIFHLRIALTGRPPGRPR